MHRATLQAERLSYPGQDCPRDLAKQLIQKYATLEGTVLAAIDAACLSSSFARLESNSNLKSLESMERKIEARNIATLEDALAKITDALRFTVTCCGGQERICAAQNYADGVMSVANNLIQQGYAIQKFKNYWECGDEYNGINAVFVVPVENAIGVPCVFELQFHTRESREAKETNHAAYEQQRAGLEKTKGLSDVMRRTADEDSFCGAEAVVNLRLHQSVVNGPADMGQRAH